MINEMRLNEPVLRRMAVRRRFGCARRMTAKTEKRKVSEEVNHRSMSYLVKNILIVFPISYLALFLIR